MSKLKNVEIKNLLECKKYLVASITIVFIITALFSMYIYYLKNYIYTIKAMSQDILIKENILDLKNYNYENLSQNKSLLDDLNKNKKINIAEETDFLLQLKVLDYLIEENNIDNYEIKLSGQTSNKVADINKNIIKSTVSVYVKSEYEKIMLFLSKLDSQVYYYFLDDVSISQNLETDVEVNAKINVSMFYFED